MKEIIRKQVKDIINESKDTTSKDGVYSYLLSDDFNGEVDSISFKSNKDKQQTNLFNKIQKTFSEKIDSQEGDEGSFISVIKSEFGGVVYKTAISGMYNTSFIDTEIKVEIRINPKEKIKTLILNNRQVFEFKFSNEFDKMSKIIYYYILNRF